MKRVSTGEAISLWAHLVGRELSDSLSENGDPVNNPVAFQVCEGNAPRTAIVVVFMPAPLAASEFRLALAQTA